MYLVDEQVIKEYAILLDMGTGCRVGGAGMGQDGLERLQKPEMFCFCGMAIQVARCLTVTRERAAEHRLAFQNGKRKTVVRRAKGIFVAD